MTKLLIVDDNEQNLYMLQVLLRGHGYEVISAGDGAEALEKARRDRPDMVIADILMPVMDGFTLCRRWKADERLKEIPFVFYTATYTDPKDEEFALSLGAERFIVKPVEPDVFVGLLLEVIEEHQAGRLVAPRQPVAEEAAYFREYNEALIRKLEDKMLQLKEANRVLERNITERKRADEEIRQLSQFRESVIDNADVWLNTLDEKVNVTIWNKAAEQISGYSREEVIGHGKIWAWLYPDEAYRKEITAKAAAIIDKGEVVEDFETTIRCKDGQNKVISWHSRNLVNEEGRPIGSIALGRDVTRQKQAEEARIRLTAAIEQSAESVVISDTEGTILYVNPAFERITGYSRAEAIGQNPRILKSGKQDAAFYRELWQTISAGQVWHGRFVNKKKDGAFYTGEATITPVRDESGAIVNYVGVQRDVTRELQLEEQFRQAQKMEAIGRLTGGIAHDFNNLLMAINGFAELMQFQLAPDDPSQEMLAKILHSGQRGADLVRQLLTFSRKQVIEPQVLDLNAMVSEVEKMLRRIIGEDIELKTILSPDLWPVKVDPAQMEQVIINLAVNARDAMPEGGPLTIETANIVLDDDYTTSHLEAQPGEHVLLAVSDTGIGMSKEVQARIFEPFFTTKEEGKGTGLGLATVFGIVKQSGGHIWGYSEERQGTTFKVYLPRAEEARPPLTRPEVGADMPAGSETILLAEDDAAVRDLARRMLQAQGYTVLEAQDGQEALQLAARYADPIHLLLTDVVMPGLSGKVLAGQLVQTHPGLKVLFMSGYTDDTIAHHGVPGLGVAFLQKPFSLVALAHKVREVLDTPLDE